MALIEWREEYCTGIKGVDYEHEMLIKQINSVYSLIAGQPDKTRVLEGLGEIYGSISAHFALEEQMMLRHRYDHYRQHKADHDRLLDDIRDISDDYEKNSDIDESLFQQRLADWFQLHFKTFDGRLHKMSGMKSHDPVSQTTLKTLIQNAKNKLLQRYCPA